MESNKDFFERLVRDHKSTIYTVCYMFSKDDDLLVVAKRINDYKRFSVNWLKIGIPFIMLWLPGFMYYASRNMGAEEQNGFFCGAIVGAIIGGAIGVYYLINSRRRLNGILNQIEEIKSGM